MVEKDTNKEPLRAQAAALITQAKAEMDAIQKALNLASRNATARDNLTSAAAQVVQLLSCPER